MTLLFVYLAFTIGISFLCSIAEAAILSLNMSHINVIKKEKPKVGELLEKFKKDMDIPIAAILIFNTIANTLGAAGIGAEAARVFGMEWVFYISVGLTLAILFFSEIIPKTIGATYYKQLAPMVAYLVRIFIFVSYPLILITLFVTRKISNNNDAHMITREELLETTLLVEDSGEIGEKESDIIENILKLNKIKVSDILTPRSVVFALEKGTKISEALENEGINRFSRVPVFVDSIDNIVGVVLSKQVFKKAIENQEDTIDSLISPIFSINENIPVSYVLDLFIKRKEHMFLVTDKYEQTEGIVTLEDCIETLLGLEIMDEFDITEDMQKLAKSKNKKKKKRKKE